ncbi:helix-turn-helix domain-containing protein [Aeromonas sp. AE23HZ002T15]
MKTVSNRIALHCLHHWQRQGRDPGQLLQGAGIAREELLLPHGRIDAPRHFRLLAQVAPHMDLARNWAPPSLTGLFSDYLPLASLCCNAASWRQALHFFLSFRPLIGECDRITLQEGDELARLSYHSESDHPDVIAMSSLANLCHLYALLQFYHPGAGQLELPTPVRPKLWRELAAWLGGRLRLGDGYRLCFPARLLDEAYEGHNAPLQPLLLGELDTQMQRLRPSPHYREQVIGLIRHQLWQQGADPRTLLACVCEALRLTRWTLHRHLREEGCHFSALLEQVRREEACRLLQDPSLRLQEVGGRLGFASQSSFTRFFKEAFAQSPSQYRSRRSRA